MKRRFVLAIDGPAGSGKSTTARLCAERLGFHYLDTGAMYRAVTLKVIEESAKREVRSAKLEGPLQEPENSEFRSQRPECRKSRRGVLPEDWQASHLTSGVCILTSALSGPALRRLLRSTTVDVTWGQGVLRVGLDGRDVTRGIREPRVSSLVSEVSAIPEVRRKMVAVQRRVAQGRSVVCEGRDIGSVVFPDAELKVFLDCDVSERSVRRVKELVEAGLLKSDVKSQKPKVKGQESEVGKVLANLRKRDRIDSTRKTAPLRRVPDAVLVDTTMLTIEEQVRIVCDLVRRKTPAQGPKAKSQKPKAKSQEADGS